MADSITTLADRSFAYPNAVILHHQIASIEMRNLTQQRESLSSMEEWWKRLSEPIAAKMGISRDEFIKRMYQSSSSGDWTEFGTEAQQLKWVNHIVQGIDETSINMNPDAEPKQSPATPATKLGTLAEEIDANGKPFAWLPHLNPKDVFFLYNPDGYFRVR